MSEVEQQAPDMAVAKPESPLAGLPLLGVGEC